MYIIFSKLNDSRSCIKKPPGRTIPGWRDLAESKVYGGVTTVNLRTSDQGLLPPEASMARTRQK